MDQITATGLILLVVNGIMTYSGLSNFSFQEKYDFHVDRILISKEYQRIISSGFLHVNWLHFAFNMIALVSFSPMIEYGFGWYGFLIIYFASLIGGSLLSLFIHRNHGDYKAVGASGAVSGIVFGVILMDPFGSSIRLLFLPFAIPHWILGTAYLAYTLWGIKSQKDNIGHEAHMGGALIGMLAILMVYPQFAIVYPWTTALLIIPVIVFLLLVIYKPEFLLLPGLKGIKVPKKQKPILSQEEELNMLLDKIQRKGLNSLSSKEKQRLRDLSR